MKAQEIRSKFSHYFEKQGHQKIESSSLVPHEDPTLLFTNAGMNQFKEYFTGQAVPENKRATTIQKCVRAGGKHNDLENVGFTARHHTFFEMLGNFSFGDYFKKDAIHFAWELLTKELQIPKDKLYVTVHDSDDEALEIWHKQEGVPRERIFKHGDKDNFWMMGDTGPCGPCSEIFYDHGEKYSDPNHPKIYGDILDDEARYVEIWNLVFMQYEQTSDDRLLLPNPCIDTGAGLERITALMQGKYWNYDSDLFEPIFNNLSNLCGKKYDPTQKYVNSMRVVADHIRASTMLITDGVIPSNEGRGYVLRRIIRRAIRHLRDLGINDVSFYKLVPSVFESLGAEYPQNKTNEALAKKLLEAEEKKFLETLDQGLKFLNQAIDRDLKSNTLPGEVAFKLYDTFGFPLDLTEVILKERNLNVDQSGFDQAMKKQKEQSKKSWKGGQMADTKIYYDILDEFKETTFTGYKESQTKAKLLKKWTEEDTTYLVFDKTPFYGESGGQVGDKGHVQLNGNTLANIDDTQKPIDGLYVHFSKDADALEEGQTYELLIARSERKLIARNHSATHLLHYALAKVLGEHVKQAGSLVSAEKLRFDFTQPEALTKAQIKEVEKIVNKEIQDAHEVTPEVMSKDEAVKKGAKALFGEKYGDEVRVISMGPNSTELCGGTHVQNTSDIGLFMILSESSLSSGIRRIEAITSSTCFNYLKDRSEVLGELESQLSVKSKKVIDKMLSLQKEVKDKTKEIKALEEKIQASQSDELFKNSKKLGNGVELVIAKAPKGADLRKLSDLFISKNPKGILLLHSNTGDKESVLLRTHKTNKQFNCSNLLKEAISEMEGRGGGKPDMAQGSGNAENLAKFILTVEKLIGSL